MDKLIKMNGRVTISNDGATILDLLDVIHPAAKALVDIAQSQDEEVGDGTTSVVLLAGELLTEAKSFIEDGLAPQTIIKGYRRALNFNLENLANLAVDLSKADKKYRYTRLSCTVVLIL